VKKNLNHITCYTCKQQGHYLYQCTEERTWRPQWAGITKRCRKIQGEDTTRSSQLGRKCIQLLPCNKYCKDMQELRATLLNGFYFPMKWQTEG
jgi:hypothetical protein